jgi:hypothetical protein
VALDRRQQSFTLAGHPKPASNNGWCREFLPPRYFDWVEQLPGDLFTFVGQTARSKGLFLQKPFSDCVSFEHFEHFFSAPST